MLEQVGDIWALGSAPNSLIGITTNGFIKRNGECAMGRGVARQAAQRYPGLPARLGNAINQLGNHVIWFKDINIFTLPVKHNWWEPADTELIARSVMEVNGLAIGLQDPDQRFYLPRPGCGNGRLKWEDVKPICEALTDQFIIVEYDGQGGEQ
jgi:hypothetical protein